MTTAFISLYKLYRTWSVLSFIRHAVASLCSAWVARSLRSIYFRFDSGDFDRVLCDQHITFHSLFYFKHLKQYKECHGIGYFLVGLHNFLESSIVVSMHNAHQGLFEHLHMSFFCVWLLNESVF